MVRVRWGEVTKSFLHSDWRPSRSSTSPSLFSPRGKCSCHQDNTSIKCPVCCPYGIDIIISELAMVDILKLYQFNVIIKKKNGFARHCATRGNFQKRRAWNVLHGMVSERMTSFFFMEPGHRARGGGGWILLIYGSTYPEDMFSFTFQHTPTIQEGMNHPKQWHYPIV